jgi:hypothetical protein|tara:strand:+ start:134 stop:547 length:414 start_codon:yes stop_codon:yes gene_type:complete
MKDSFRDILSKQSSSEDMEQKKSSSESLERSLGKDNVNPEYYKDGDIECIDALETVASLNSVKEEIPSQMNAIKYLWRYNNKENPFRDIQKTLWYVARILLNKLKKDETFNSSGRFSMFVGKYKLTIEDETQEEWTD